MNSNRPLDRSAFHLGVVNHIAKFDRRASTPRPSTVTHACKVPIPRPILRCPPVAKPIPIVPSQWIMKYVEMTHKGDAPVTASGNVIIQSIMNILSIFLNVIHEPIGTTLFEKVESNSLDSAFRMQMRRTCLSSASVEALRNAASKALNFMDTEQKTNTLNDAIITIRKNMLISGFFQENEYRSNAFLNELYNNIDVMKHGLKGILSWRLIPIYQRLETLMEIENAVKMTIGNGSTGNIELYYSEAILFYTVEVQRLLVLTMSKWFIVLTKKMGVGMMSADAFAKMELHIEKKQDEFFEEMKRETGWQREAVGIDMREVHVNFNDL